MSRDFVIPEFLKNQSVDEIHQKMLGALPLWLDKSSGSVAYDFMLPTAIEKAQMVEFVLIEAIKNMFPEWAYGINLDYLAQTRGLIRKAATKANGQISVTVQSKMEIPAGTKFATESNYGESSVEFEASHTTQIQGTGLVAITALLSGVIGNVAAGTIKLLRSPIEGITAVINNLPITGGSESETDDRLRARLMEYDLNQGNLYVGSMADYKRWALEVDGVGSALVIPANDDTGLVRIVLTDTNGSPASAELCTAVFANIMCPSAPLERKAPVNALLSVTPPRTVLIAVIARVTMAGGNTVSETKQSFVLALKQYYKQALSDREVKYSKVIQLLMETAGVLDVTALSINAGTKNIPVNGDELPITAESDVVFL